MRQLTRKSGGDLPPLVKQVKLEAEIKVEKVGKKKKKKTKVERSEREVGLEGGASHLEGRFSCNDVTRGTREKSLTTV